jgi:hypothetical protein
MSELLLVFIISFLLGIYSTRIDIKVNTWLKNRKNKIDEHEGESV